MRQQYVTSRRSGGAMWRLSLAALVLTTLAGCGFHLQGSSPLPKGISSVHVTYEDDYRVGTPPLVKSLKQRLRRQNLLGGQDAASRLDMVEVENRRQLSAVSPINADSAEYALTSRARFDYWVKGHKVLSDEKVSLTRFYTVSVTQKLSSEGERDQLLTEMQRHLADMVLERIARADKKASAGKDTDAGD